MLHFSKLKAFGILLAVLVSIIVCVLAVEAAATALALGVLAALATVRYRFPLREVVRLTEIGRASCRERG